MISKKVSEEEFLETLNTCKVVRKRLEVFKSFVLIFNKVLHDTYLGKEYIVTPEEIKGHYNWCFNSVCKQFNTIGFNFSDNTEVAEHFFEYFTYYIYEKETELREKEIEKFYVDIFSLHGEKFYIQVNELITLYNKFNKTFSDGKSNRLLTK